VIATHYPFINVPGYYFLKMHQERYYLSAIENCDSLKYGRLDGMYLDADPQGYSLRNYKNYLIFGCTNHRTGEYKPKDAYTKIDAGVKRWYPDAKIKYFWSNQDCMTPDSIPYIGKYSVITPNIYVATGFNQWGMSGSMVSAMIISDMILGRRNDYHKVFSPTRLMFSGSSKMIKDTGIITNSLLAEYMKAPHDKLDDIGVGEAGVSLVQEDGSRGGSVAQPEPAGAAEIGDGKEQASVEVGGMVERCERRREGVVIGKGLGARLGPIGLPEVPVLLVVARGEIERSVDVGQVVGRGGEGSGTDLPDESRFGRAGSNLPELLGGYVERPAAEGQFACSE
jgi:hypothetical protein